VPAELCRLDGTHAVRVLGTETGHRAEPVTLVGGTWQRSTAGDGAGIALLHRLRNRSAVEDGFRVAGFAWEPVDEESERAMGVDQTNESWVVGGRVVVKWVTDDLEGPHPGADRMRRLADAGFDRTPTLVGLVEWQNPSGDWAPVAVVTEHLPGAEDGWTWAVAETRRELGMESGPTRPFAEDLGRLTGRMHVALADGSVLDDGLAAAQAVDACETLELAIRLTGATDPGSSALLVAERDRILVDLSVLDGMSGLPAVHVHGDFHVGQVLRSPSGELSVIDFDGNPTRPAQLRAAPGPAARDVAGMLVSLENVAHVVSHHAPEVDEHALGAWTARAQDEFLSSYVDALGDRHDLYDASLLPAFVWEQVCREFVYAARHLPRWGYVPAAALRKRTGAG
jgi:maltokinase